MCKQPHNCQDNFNWCAEISDNLTLNGFLKKLKVFRTFRIRELDQSSSRVLQATECVLCNDRQAV